MCADDFIARGAVAVWQVSVVALDDEVVAEFFSDAVNDDAEVRMTVGDDLSDVVIGCAAEEDEVAVVDRGRHGVAGDDDVAEGAAK